MLARLIFKILWGFGIAPLVARPITISEIQYSGSEFLELYNHTDAPVDLTSYSIIGGIDAFLAGTIEPGAFAVVVEDTRSFQIEHGRGPRILAEFDRKLDNDGEEIAIRDPGGQIVLSFEYRATPVPNIPRFANWPPKNLNEKLPLELIDPDNPDLDFNDGANWRRAFRKNASPGRGSDSDRDGLDDSWENHYFYSLDALPSNDPDGDTLNNLAEQRRFSNPIHEDTDGDGLLDKHETATGVFTSLEDTGTLPYDKDSDDDELTDEHEIPINTPKGAYPTDPNNRDSDNDSYPDGDEVNYRGDPRDPDLIPQAPEIASFLPEFFEVRAGQPVQLKWEVHGSRTLQIDRPQEGSKSIYSLSSGLTFLPSHQTELIPPDQTWKYDLSTEDFGTTWTSPDFDDSTWLTGATPFIGFDTSNNRPEFSTHLHDAETSPYFRTTLELANVIPSQRIQAHWLVESGGAFYLNGRLIHNVGLPATFTRETRAIGDFQEITFSPDIFGGRQHLAASSHYPPGLFEWRFTRLYFDLSLRQIDPITGPQTYTLTAINPYGTVQKTVEVNILDDLPPLQTYQQWAMETFPNDLAFRDDQADPDQDGISNLMEFLTVSDPLTPNNEPLKIKPVYYPMSDDPSTSGKFRWFDASFQRHRNPGNANVQLETSEDLITWTPLPTQFNPSRPYEPTVEITDEQREKLSYRVYRKHRPKFLRLRSTTAP